MEIGISRDHEQLDLYSIAYYLALLMLTIYMPILSGLAREVLFGLLTSPINFFP